MNRWITVSNYLLVSSAWFFAGVYAQRLWDVRQRAIEGLVSRVR